MSDILDDNEDYQEDIEQVEDNEVIDDEQDIDDSQDGEQDSDEPDDSADDDALDFSFDDDGDSDEKDPFAGQDAPQWVKDNRRRAKEVQRENRELKRKLEQYESSNTPEQQALREMPTLESHEYEEAEYQADIAKWFEEKQRYEAAVQAEQQKYQQYHERYKANVDAVRAKAPDYDDAETMVVETLSMNKQHLLQMMVEKPAAVVYALGKNSPTQLENLSKLDDIQFARQIVLMEQQMSSKSKSRNPNKPKPKTHELEGAAGGTDAKLAKLEADAERTNDRTALIAYRKQMKNK